MKILFEGAMSMSSGYGKDSIGIIRALQERGHSVTVTPVSSLQVPLPTDIVKYFSVEFYQEPPYDVRITHQSPIDVALSPEDAAKAKINIWWSMWEWENFPEEEINYGRAYVSLKERTRAYDYFVAYDSLSMSALSPWIDDSLKKVTCQGGYEAEDWMPDSNDKVVQDEFIVGSLGDMSGRKNPLALIQAFRLFKDAHPQAKSSLLIKSRRPFLGEFVGTYTDPEYHIAEINGIWTRDQMEKFYRGLGVYVAPSYGEGKNLPALEAATNGVPLILSDVPGHRSWATMFDSIIFVGGKESNLRINGIPMWGLKVDVDELAEAIGTMYLNRHLYSEKARANVRSIAQSMDWTRALERLGNLTEIGFL